MNEEKRYPISEELFNGIIPIIRRLEGLALVLDTLGENIGRDKSDLWGNIYAEYPELRGKPLKIDEVNKEITVVQLTSETPKIVTLSEG